MNKNTEVILEFADGRNYTITLHPQGWDTDLLKVLKETTIVGVKVKGVVTTETKSETSFKVHAT